jgi:hypothetical protein
LPADRPVPAVWPRLTHVGNEKYLADFWIIEAFDLDVALNLATEESRGCNRKAGVQRSGRPSHSPAPGASKVASHICLNLLGSARALNGTTPPASERATRPLAASHLSVCPWPDHRTTPPGHRAGMGGVPGRAGGLRNHLN